MNKQYRLSQNDISLAGTWQVCLASYEEREKKEKVNIDLPASVTEKGLGVKNTRKELLFLSEKFQYVGKAVFTRKFILLEASEQAVYFYMERSRVTKLWVNGAYVGSRDLLTSEQEYDISSYVHVGDNMISVEVDNTYETVPKDCILGSHMASEHTQTNWNGILGEIGIRILPKIHPVKIHIYSNAEQGSVKVKVSIASQTENTKGVKILCRQPMCGEEAKETEQQYVEVTRAECEMNPGVTELTLEGKLQEETPLWSEFSPRMTSIQLVLDSSEGQYVEEIPFGLRDYQVSEDGRHFAVNGKNIFVRSEANCAVFPLTGYAPMDEEAWDALFDTYKAYGINYVRFHSWCPPDAAFCSADKKGMYLQPELCEWTFHTFEDDREYDYYTREAMAIIDQYGNHPSLVAMTWGNELRSDNRDRMGELCRIMRAYDPTRLYAEGSNTWYGQQGVDAASDFVMAQGNFQNFWRGAFAGNTGFINDMPPGAKKNYTAELEEIHKPAISFEVGQFQVYPDYDEIEEYQGVLEARNLASYKSMMETNGLQGMDKAFHQASGKLAMLCYREEIEAAMRTPDLAGISLLGLQDFSGQGTALVGMVDALGQSKKFVNPAEFKQFFDAVTPLLMFDKRSFCEEETAECKVLIHNFGAETLHETVTVEIYRNQSGECYERKEWKPDKIEQGKLSEIAYFSLTFPKVDMPEEFTIQVEIGTRKNVYPVYVYPWVSVVEEKCIATKLDDETCRRLEEGENLILLPELSSAAIPQSYPASYISDFWCWVMFKKWDCHGTMGLLLDKEHPIFDLFPTENHTDWRWWKLLQGSRAVALTGTDFSPLMIMIDNLQRNEQLAMAFETRVGKGKLLICTLNLTDREDVSVAAFLRSAIAYIRSDAFRPVSVTTKEQLQDLLPGVRRDKTGNVVATTAGINRERAENAITDTDKVWDTVGLQDTTEAYYEMQFDVAQQINTVQAFFLMKDMYATGDVAYDLPGKMNVLYRQGHDWKPVEVIFATEINVEENIVKFRTVTTDAIRIVFDDDDREAVNVAATSLFAHQPFAVQRIKVY